MDEVVPVHRVECATCTGEVLDQGALVLRWAPTGADPVLFVAPATSVRPGRAPHAGIPVCWPWFGPGRTGGMTPAHGVVRDVDWVLVDRVDAADAVSLHHRISSAAVASPYVPNPFILDLRTRLGSVLELELTTTNSGGEPFEIEEALHTYLAVGDVRRVRIEGLDGTAYLDKTTGLEHAQSGDLVLDGETDRVHRGDGPVTVVDPILRRRLRVTTEGAADRVVWNPWHEKGSALADVGDAWSSFVCVEGGNVLDDAVVVRPGASHTLTYRVEVLPA